MNLQAQFACPESCQASCPFDLRKREMHNRAEMTYSQAQIQVHPAATVEAILQENPALHMVRLRNPT